MPSSDLCLRIVCGQFVWTFWNFMTKRAKMAKKMHIRKVTTRNKMEVLLFVILVRFLLCCGDVECNPGPLSGTRFQNEETSSDGKQGNSSIYPSDHLYQPSSDIQHDTGKEILEAIRTQSNNFQTLERNMSSIVSNLETIKSDISHVKSECEMINNRCSKLEKDTADIRKTVTENKAEIEELFEECDQRKIESTRLTKKTRDLENTIDNLKSEVDRLEGFSRRNNLRMFGIPSCEETETYDSCAQSVIKALNSVSGSRQWSTDDIERAHRVGKSKEGQSKTMIVRFFRWKDKMNILSDKVFRDNLEKKGVKVVNDLTRNQASLVSAARKEGNVAYFKRGKMIIEPRKPESRKPDPRTPDPRSYAEVTASVNDKTVADDRRSVSCDQRERRKTGDWTNSKEQRSEDYQGKGDSPFHYSAANQSESVAREFRGSVQKDSQPKQRSIEHYVRDSPNCVSENKESHYTSRRSARKKTTA